MAELLTVKEVAKVLKLTTRSVYKLISGGDIPHCKISGSIRVREEDLSRYIKSSRSAS